MFAHFLFVFNVDYNRIFAQAPVNPVPFTTPLPAAIPQAVQQIVPPPAPVVQPMQQPPAYIEPAQTYHQDVGVSLLPYITRAGISVASGRWPNSPDWLSS